MYVRYLLKSTNMLLKSTNIHNVLLKYTVSFVQAPSLQNYFKLPKEGATYYNKT